MSFKRFFSTMVMAVTAVITGMFFMTGGQAQEPDTGFTIKAIEIQYVGPASISRQRIMANMRTSVGQPYNESIIEEDIRNLYKTNEISNVRIFSEPSGDGVRVVVVIQTRSSVREVVFQGVTKFRIGRIRKQVETEPGQALNEAQLETDRQKLVEYYQKRGYSDVDVQYSVDTDETAGQAKVTFSIAEGEKSIVRELAFEGNTAFTAKELRKQVKTRPKNLLSFINKSGKIEDEQIMADIAALETFYQEDGYADMRVRDVREDPIRGTGVKVVYVIEEGPRYTLGEIRLSGNEVLTSDEIVTHIQMKTGGPYSPALMRRDIKVIRDLYGAQGYVDANVYPEAVPVGNNVVNLTYAIDEGFQSYVERINIEGNTKTKDKVIRRELAVAPGDIYDTTRVEASRLRLQNVGYFSRVDAYDQDTLIPGRKDLNVVVEEKRTGSFNFGAGFSSIDNLIGFAEIQQSNFDVTNWPRFTGAGQKFRARAQFGTRRKDFILGLTEPWFMDHQLAVGGELFYREATYLSDVYDQRNYGGAFSVRKPLGLFTSAKLEYRLENIGIYDVDNDASEEIKSEEGDRLQSLLGLEINHDTRDSVFLTRKGHRLIAGTYVAGGPLGGDTDIYGWSLEGSKYWGLPGDTIFMVNAEIAVVDSWNGGERVPIFNRLYLGGANNLRGFDFREVGPKDEDGEPIGGNSMARITVEYTFPIIDRIRGAVFYDAGFVNAGSYEFSASNYNSDVGFGIRMDLPIGPVRVDFGIPLEADDYNDSSGKFNFNIGYQF